MAAADTPKRMVVLYFAPSSGKAAKDFAGRMRLTDGVNVTMVWAQKFQDEADVYYNAGAVVIEEGIDQAELIAATYAAFSPETEIHYMTSDGEWAQNEVEEDAEVGEEPAVSAEAAPAAEDYRSDRYEPADTGVTLEVGEDSEGDSGDDLDDREPSEDGDEEESER